jgi:hypothetical protein
MLRRPRAPSSAGSLSASSNEKKKEKNDIPSPLPKNRVPLLFMRFVVSGIWVAQVSPFATAGVVLGAV